MKPPALIALTLSVMALGAPSLLAQAPTNANSEALRLLRQTIAAQTRHPDLVIHNLTNDLPVVPAKPPLATPSTAAAAELERRYLAGKLSLREYEKSLARLQLKPPGPANASSPSAPDLTGSPKAGSKPPRNLEPASSAPPPQPTERQKKISEVESRLDDMIRAKEARDRAAQTNAPAAPAAVPGKKLTQRERLDYLLRQVIAGKLSDEEYKKERERILAEPE